MPRRLQILDRARAHAQPIPTLSIAELGRWRRFARLNAAQCDVTWPGAIEMLQFRVLTNFLSRPPQAVNRGVKKIRERRLALHEGEIARGMG
jgi:hypothetical protein